MGEQDYITPEETHQKLGKSVEYSRLGGMGHPRVIPCPRSAQRSSPLVDTPSENGA